MHESDSITFLNVKNMHPHRDSENYEQKTNFKYFFHILFPNMQILNKIIDRGRHSLVLEVEMDHFWYCTNNCLGVESVTPSATPKPVE